jgi:transposase-like protein
VNGVSTRKVDRLVEALGLAGVSKDTASRRCAGLDEQVTAFRERPLDSNYPYLWLDAKVEKVRAGGRVEHRALVVAYGVDASGQREVIGLDGARPRPRRSGESSCAAWSAAAWPGCSWSSPTPTRVSSRPSPRC